MVRLDPGALGQTGLTGIVVWLDRSSAIKLAWRGSRC